MRLSFIDAFVVLILSVMLVPHLRLVAQDVPPADGPVHLAPVEGRKNRHKHDHIEPAPDPDPLIDVKPEPIPTRPKPVPDRNFNNVKPLPPIPKPEVVLPVKPPKPGLFAFVGTWLWRLVLTILVGAFLCGVGLSLAVRRFRQRW